MIFREDEIQAEWVEETNDKAYPKGPLSVYERSRRNAQLKKEWLKEREDSARRRERDIYTFRPKIHNTPDFSEAPDLGLSAPREKIKFRHREPKPASSRPTTDQQQAINIPAANHQASLPSGHQQQHGVVGEERDDGVEHDRLFCKPS